MCCIVVYVELISNTSYVWAVELGVPLGGWEAEK